MKIKNISRKQLIATCIAVFATIVLGVLFYYNSVINEPLKIDGENIEIEVHEGEAFNSVLDTLENLGVLRNKLAVKMNLKLSKRDIVLIPGSYTLNRNITLDELVDKLQTEDITKNQKKVTIPEGYRIDLIAERLEESGLFSKDEFIQAVKTYTLPNYVKNDARKKYNLEGYLYPDTYYFNKNSTPKEVIDIMLNKFKETLKDIEAKNNVDIKDSEIENLIIKASLIERETVLDDERPLVSSVIENRLKKHMKLEFCSTVNYVLGYENKTDLTYKDVSVDSPFNTYKYDGLPVGPIASPGVESIIAVLKPANTDYLYFVLLKGTGGKQHFSKTEDEHNQVKKEQGY